MSCIIDCQSSCGFGSIHTHRSDLENSVTSSRLFLHSPHATPMLNVLLWKKNNDLIRIEKGEENKKQSLPFLSFLLSQRGVLVADKTRREPNYHKCLSSVTFRLSNGSLSIPLPVYIHIRRKGDAVWDQNLCTSLLKREQLLSWIGTSPRNALHSPLIVTGSSPVADTDNSQTVNRQLFLFSLSLQLQQQQCILYAHFMLSVWFLWSE